MKFYRIAFLLSVLAISATHTKAQVTKISEQVKENFTSQYPDAQNIRWFNDVVKVNVQFEIGDDKMDAQYTNKGIWRNTLKMISFDDLPDEVKDGFDKSKYAGREVTDVRIVYLPDEIIQYRIKTEKNNVQRKYLYFNEEGRLLRDVNTL